jgi:hypothetical protein
VDIPPFTHRSSRLKTTKPLNFLLLHCVQDALHMLPS